jgi:hypothetical protein
VTNRKRGKEVDRACTDESKSLPTITVHHTPLHTFRHVIIGTVRLKFLSESVSSNRLRSRSVVNKECHAAVRPYMAEQMTISSWAVCGRRKCRWCCSATMIHDMGRRYPRSAQQIIHSFLVGLATDALQALFREGGKRKRPNQDDDSCNNALQIAVARKALVFGLCRDILWRREEGSWRQHEKCHNETIMPSAFTRTCVCRGPPKAKMTIHSHYPAGNVAWTDCSR